jgi:hypothetical protein
MLLRDMVYDGHVPGLRVAPEWWEPRHPQEYLPAVDDPVALRDPAPDRNRVPYTVRWPLIDDQFQPIYTPQLNGFVGTLIASARQPVTGEEVGTETGTTDRIIVNRATGTEADSEVGDVTVLVQPDVTSLETILSIGQNEGVSPDISEQGNEATAELGTASVNVQTAVTGNEASTELADEDTQVVEAGWGSGAFGEGTYSN